MKRSKFSESQMAFILRQAEEGTSIEEVCRKAGIGQATSQLYETRIRRMGNAGRNGGSILHAAPTNSSDDQGAR